MIKIFAITLVTISVVYAAADHSSTMPSYVILPAMPQKPTQPSPGEPSSYPIENIRDKRAAMNSTSLLKSSVTSSSSEEATPTPSSKDEAKPPSFSTKEIKNMKANATREESEGASTVRPVVYSFKFNETQPSQFVGKMAKN